MVRRIGIALACVLYVAWLAVLWALVIAAITRATLVLGTGADRWGLL